MEWVVSTWKGGRITFQKQVYYQKFSKTLAPPCGRGKPPQLVTLYSFRPVASKTVARFWGLGGKNTFSEGQDFCLLLCFYEYFFGPKNICGGLPPGYEPGEYPTKLATVCHWWNTSLYLSACHIPQVKIRSNTFRSCFWRTIMLYPT